MISSLFVVDREALDDAWRSTALSVVTAARPRGRFAGLLGGAGADTMAASRALPSLGVATARRAYAALVEDLALAAVHDVPEEILLALWPSWATRRGLAEPAYPPELTGGQDLLVLPTPEPPTSPVGAPLAAAVAEALLPLLTAASISGRVVLLRIG